MPGAEDKGEGSVLTYVPSPNSESNFMCPGILTEA